MKNLNLKIFTYFTFAALAFSLFFVGMPAWAAEITIESEIEEVRTGRQFEASIFLNPEGQYINAIEGKLLFPAELVEVVEVRDANSIINFWIERPQTKPGSQISFAGIIPGGYVDARGPVFSVVFQSKKSGIGLVELHEARALLNDGRGTGADLTVSDLRFVISDTTQATQASIDQPKDEDSPEPFQPEIARDPNVYSGKYFLVFATQDKLSGIDRYEVCEGQRRCVVATSPYLLKDQGRYERTIVKAIDKSGNERIEILPASQQRPWYKDQTIIAIIFIITVVVYTLHRIIRRKFADGGNLQNKLK